MVYEWGGIYILWEGVGARSRTYPIPQNVNPPPHLRVDIAYR